MQKSKPYRCLICGAEVPDLPMPVLQHQTSHVPRRPYAKSASEPAKSEQESESAASDSP